jgi:hypothetical protein
MLLIVFHFHPVRPAQTTPPVTVPCLTFTTKQLHRFTLPFRPCACTLQCPPHGLTVRLGDPQKHFPEHLPPQNLQPHLNPGNPRAPANALPPLVGWPRRREVERGPRDSPSPSDVAAPPGHGAPAPPTLTRRHRPPLRSSTALPGFS